MKTKEQMYEDIEKILEELGIENYTINNDGTVNVGGDVDLNSKGLNALPIQFGSVSGDFDCSDNELTSLEGAPSEVGGFFNCWNNQLTNLKHAPSHVGRSFNCWDNQLTSLEGKPEHIGGEFLHDPISKPDSFVESIETEIQELEQKIEGLKDLKIRYNNLGKNLKRELERLIGDD